MKQQHPVGDVGGNVLCAWDVGGQGLHEGVHIEGVGVVVVMVEGVLKRHADARLRSQPNLHLECLYSIQPVQCVPVLCSLSACKRGRCWGWDGGMCPLPGLKGM